ncbi:MAG TPA: signal peptidase I [Patescibacteria group bacterium]|nr:signal peptidase I [Patescibacteria group bacterium]
MKKVFNIISWVLFAAVAVLAILLIASTGKSTNKFSVKVVLSPSMEPNIKTGSVIITTPSKEYQIGDVITYSRAGNKIPITHRIVDVSIENGTQYFKTKGDNNEDPDDAKVSKINIIGKVRWSIPYIGYGLNAVKNPIGFAVIIVVPATILIYGEVINIKKELERMAAERKKKKVASAGDPPKRREDNEEKKENPEEPKV